MGHCGMGYRSPSIDYKDFIKFYAHVIEFLECQSVFICIAFSSFLRFRYGLILNPEKLFVVIYRKIIYIPSGNRFSPGLIFANISKLILVNSRKSTSTKFGSFSYSRK